MLQNDLNDTQAAAGTGAITGIGIDIGGGGGGGGPDRSHIDDLVHGYS